MPAAVETMFSVREIPWHGLGEIVEEQLTAAQALTTAGLDWKVQLDALRTVHGEDVPGHYAVMRTDRQEALGVVGKRYTPLQNNEAFTFFDNIVDSGEAKYETAGSLQGGKKIWIMATLPEGVTVGGVDPTQIFVLLTNNHDGGGSVQAAITPVRVVCANTLNMALRGAKRSWKIRHTASMTSRFAEAREALDIAFEYTASWEAEMETLLAQSMDEREYKRFAEALAEDLEFSERATEDLVAVTVPMFAEGQTLENIAGTRYAALNAVGEWVEHLRKGRRGGESILRSNWEDGGKARQVRGAAFALLKS